MSALAFLALAAGLVCALAPLAQAARIGATRSAHDVSLIWLCLYAAGSAVWIVYGAAIGSLPLVVSQSAAFVSVGVALVLARRYRKAVPRSPGAAPPRGRRETRRPADARTPRAGRRRTGSPAL